MRFFKYKPLRKYRTDLWGLLSTKTYLNGPLRSLISLLDYTNARGNYKQLRLTGFIGTSGFKAILETRNKLRLYYGGLTKKEYLNLYKAAYKMTGNLTGNLISVFEFQLYVVVYRMNFAPSLRIAAIRVKMGFYSVNRQVVTNPKVVVTEGSVVEVVICHHPFICSEIRNAILTKKIFAPFPRYFEVNFATLQGILLFKPTLAEVPFPFYVNPSFFIAESLQRFR